MKAFMHHLGYEFKAGVRDAGLMMMNYLFPLGFFFLMAALMTRLNPLFTATMVPAMAIFAMMSSYLMGLPGTIVAAREAGIYRSYRINGVPSASILAIPALSLLAHAAAISTIILAVATLGFGAPVPDSYGRFALAWACGAAAIAGLGDLIGVASPDNRASILLSQAIFIPSIMLGGLMIPQSLLPSGLDRLALLFPATHAMKAFRGDPGWPASIAYLASGAILAFAASGCLFEWDPRNARPGWRCLLGLAALVPYAIASILG